MLRLRWKYLNSLRSNRNPFYTLRLRIFLNAIFLRPFYISMTFPFYNKIIPQSAESLIYRTKTSLHLSGGSVDAIMVGRFARCWRHVRFQPRVKPRGKGITSYCALQERRKENWLSSYGNKKQNQLCRNHFHNYIYTWFSREKPYGANTNGGQNGFIYISWRDY